MTPIAGLQRIQLEAGAGESAGQFPAGIGAEQGFSNPSRFAQLFRRTYGAYPSEALRAHGEGSSLNSAVAHPRPD